MKNFEEIIKLFHKKNLFLGLSVVIKFMAIVVAVLITRWQNQYLDSETLKNFNLTVAYLVIILGIIGFGIPQIIYKLYSNEIDQNKLNDIWSTFFIVRIFSYFIGVLIILLTYRFSGVNDLFMIFGVFSAQFILLSDQNFRSVVDSRDLSQRFSLTDLIGKVFLTLVLYLAVWFNLVKNDNISFFIFSSIIIYFGVYILDQIINLKFTKFTGFKISVFKNHFKSMIFLALPGLFLVSATDRFFLGYFNTDNYIFNGYTNAIKIYEVSLVFPGLIVPVLASRLKLRIKTNNSKNPKSDFKKYVLYLFSIGSLYAFFIWLFSPIIFNIVDPNKLYSNYSLQVIPFLSLSIICSFINLLYYNFNIFSHREKLELIYYYIYAICILCLYFVSAMVGGYIGLSIGILIGNYADLLIRIFIFKVKL